MVEQVYRPRKPKESPLWQYLCAHFYDTEPVMMYANG
jgi:hypothetical protein